MRVELPSGTPAEVARPAEPPSRGLVLIPDIGGLRPLFDGLAAGLSASHGWSVCVVEPWPGRQDMALEERLASVGTIGEHRLLGDLAAAADVCDGEPVAVLGFCMGAMFALRAADLGRFDRVVSFYGMVRVPEQWRSPTVGEPLAAVGSPGAAPVLALVGTDDPWVPAADLDALEAAGATVVRYPGADHGFVHDPSRPTHRPDDAADAWARVIAFLSE